MNLRPYRDKTLRRPSGILAFHITNSYLDLRPVILGAAKHFGLKAVWVHSLGDGRASASADWMLLLQDNEILRSGRFGKALGEQLPQFHAMRPWTDAYSNLIQILNR